MMDWTGWIINLKFWLLKLFQYDCRQTGNSIKCRTYPTDTNTATGNSKPICDDELALLICKEKTTTILIMIVSFTSLREICSFDNPWNPKHSDFDLTNPLHRYLLAVLPLHSVPQGVEAGCYQGDCDRLGNRLFDAPRLCELCQPTLRDQTNSSSYLSIACPSTLSKWKVKVDIYIVRVVLGSIFWLHLAPSFYIAVTASFFQDHFNLFLWVL